MNRVFAAALSVPKTCVRRLSVTGVRCEKPDMTEIKRKQMHFQANDDVPIYLKGGTKDYVLFITTLVLVAVGFAGSVHSTYKLAQKK